MKCKVAGFFNRQFLFKDKQINNIPTAASPAAPSFSVPHKIQKIELTNLNSEAISLLLTPSIQTNDVLDLCLCINQDFDLLGSEHTSPIFIQEKENFCVLVQTSNPQSFLHLLKNAKAITEQEKCEVLQRIRTSTTEVTPQKI